MDWGARYECYRGDAHGGAMSTAGDAGPDHLEQILSVRLTVVKLLFPLL